MSFLVKMKTADLVRLDGALRKVRILSGLIRIRSSKAFSLMPHASITNAAEFPVAMTKALFLMISWIKSLTNWVYM